MFDLGEKNFEEYDNFYILANNKYHTIYYGHWVKETTATIYIESTDPQMHINNLFVCKRMLGKTKSPFVKLLSVDQILKNADGYIIRYNDIENAKILKKKLNS